MYSGSFKYDFHDNYIKEKYGLLFIDIDSLCYEIETGDAHKDFWADKDKFDTSDYAKDNPYFTFYVLRFTSFSGRRPAQRE